MRSSLIRKGAGNNAGAMDAGDWAHPRYNFSPSPLDFRGRYPRNASGPRAIRGSRMMSLSSRPFHYSQFPDNSEMHSNPFMVGSDSEPFDPKRFKWNKIKKYKKFLFYQQLQRQKKGPAINQQPQTSGGAVKNPQKQQKTNANQPKPSGGAAKRQNRLWQASVAKNPQQPKTPVVSQPKTPQQPKTPLVTKPKTPQQPKTPVVTKPKTPQQPKSPVVTKPKSPVVTQPKNPVVTELKIPQQPITPVFSPTANTGAKQEKRTATQNGGTTEETKDADVPTQPHKKLKTEETMLPAELPIHGWRGDTSTMFSCSLCRYYTPDEREMQVHFYSSQHKEILKHLYIFYPKQRVDFLHNYLLYKKRKMAMEQKNNLLPVKDKFKGIGQEHFLHRVQAALCQACNVLIPDDPELLTNHIKSEGHQQKCKVTVKNIKVSSLAAAKELLLDQEILQMLKIYISGRNPFKDTVACPSKVVSSTPEILVAEEDDEDYVNMNDDDDDHSVDDTKDTIANAKSGQEVPANKDSGQAVSVNTDKTAKEEAEEEEEEEEAAEAP
ncbi:DBIRD complex subunit ZNF326-like isoform X2 [Ranitomeya imitator]|uniref:DBIRD complex subunit ZNF326-like isoform X2 n=1 Tax=Ranitomeya imitator TaxID=111125 RepID=UPI0037E9A6CE